MSDTYVRKATGMIKKLNERLDQGTEKAMKDTYGPGTVVDDQDKLEKTISKTITQDWQKMESGDVTYYKDEQRATVGLWDSDMMAGMVLEVQEQGGGEEESIDVGDRIMVVGGEEAGSTARITKDLGNDKYQAETDGDKRDIEVDRSDFEVEKILYSKTDLDGLRKFLQGEGFEGYAEDIANILDSSPNITENPNKEIWNFLKDIRGKADDWVKENRDLLSDPVRVLESLKNKKFKRDDLLEVYLVEAGLEDPSIKEKILEFSPDPDHSLTESLGLQHIGTRKLIRDHKVRGLSIEECEEEANALARLAYPNKDFIKEIETVKRAIRGELNKVNEETPFMNLRSEGEWNNEDALEYAEKVFEILGQPDEITTSEIVWSNPDEVFSRLEVRDEQTQHDHPVPHDDFVYVALPLEVSDGFLDNISRVTDNAIVDQSKGEVLFRCNNVANCAIIASVVEEMLDGDLTTEDAKEEVKSRLKSGELPRWYDNKFGDTLGSDIPDRGEGGNDKPPAGGEGGDAEGEGEDAEGEGEGEAATGENLHESNKFIEKKRIDSMVERQLSKYGREGLLEHLNKIAPRLTEWMSRYSSVDPQLLENIKRGYGISDDPAKEEDHVLKSYVVEISKLNSYTALGKRVFEHYASRSLPINEDEKETLREFWREAKKAEELGSIKNLSDIQIDESSSRVESYFSFIHAGKNDATMKVWVSEDDDEVMLEAEDEAGIPAVQEVSKGYFKKMLNGELEQVSGPDSEFESRILKHLKKDDSTEIEELDQGNIDRGASGVERMKIGEEEVYARFNEEEGRVEYEVVAEEILEDRITQIDYLLAAQEDPLLESYEDFPLYREDLEAMDLQELKRTYRKVKRLDEDS